MSAHGTGSLEAHLSGTDFRTGRGPAEAWRRPGVGPGVGRRWFHDRGSPGHTLYVRGAAPDPVQEATATTDPDRAEGRNPTAHETAACAPLTRTYSSAWRHATTQSRRRPRRRSSRAAHAYPMSFSSNLCGSFRRSTALPLPPSGRRWGSCLRTTI